MPSPQTSERTRELGRRVVLHRGSPGEVRMAGACAELGAEAGGPGGGASRRRALAALKGEGAARLEPLVFPPGNRKGCGSTMDRSGMGCSSSISRAR